ncbi:carboxymuconolactone decarboxylase family protein [Actinosynnema sp. ALI-1.44]|uniref:carboxymuconolactone decarboxylase family protein n=1 Tax=Actinosynnema sp. ALI-1.44 TaxID=1933779 RepID=UPI00143CC5B8|nr:carboxymuconolactone decarboxylase family protein [Actinosynnema sp. ALI-1.44]
MSELNVFRHVTPVSPNTATGPVAAVYDQVDRDFSTIGPAVMMLSPAPELLAPCWALLREALVSGSVPRWRKEIVAVSVSRTNGCEYDIAGHTVFLHLAGAPADAVERNQELVRWAQHGGPAPFSVGDTPEYVATALALHFVNRLVSILLDPGLRPGGMRDGSAFDGAPIARAIRADHEPGESLALLDSVPTEGIPTWAGDSPAGPAYAALRDAARRGGFLLSERARQTVQDAISRGDTTPVDEPGARLAVLAGLAPGRITETDVKTWRSDKYTDHCLLHLFAYGAITAIERIEHTLA